MIEQFFSDQVVSRLTQVLLDNFMPLHPADLSLWESDPDRFFLDSQMALQNEKIRPAAHSLFRLLLDKHTDAVSSVVVAYFERAVKQSLSDRDGSYPMNSDYYNLVIFKECVYAAVGIGCFELHPKLNMANFSFNYFLEQVLVPELQIASKVSNKDTVLRVLRARIATLVGEWYAMDPLAKAYKLPVYGLLIELLKIPTLLFV